MRATSRVGFFIGLAMLADIAADFVQLAFRLVPMGGAHQFLSWYVQLLTKLGGSLRVMTVLLGVVLVGQYVVIRLVTKSGRNRPAEPMHSSPGASSQRKKCATSMSEDAFPVGVALLAFVAWGVCLEVQGNLLARALRPTDITVGLLYRWYFQGTLRPAIVILGILLVGQLPIVWLLSKPDRANREVDPELHPAAAMEPEEQDAASEILKERLASGDIDVEEYGRIRAALKGK